jgi:hypothetical protein
MTTRPRAPLSCVVPPYARSEIVILPFNQGRPLPPDFAYTGQWIIENIVFLHDSDDTQSHGGTAPRFTAWGTTSDGKRSFGFAATQLAAAFEIDVSDLFAANRDGSFSLLGTNDASDLHGIPAKRYVFALGDKRAALIIEAEREPGLA